MENRRKKHRAKNKQSPESGQKVAKLSSNEVQKHISIFFPRLALAFSLFSPSRQLTSNVEKEIDSRKQTKRTHGSQPKPDSLKLDSRTESPKSNQVGSRKQTNTASPRRESKPDSSKSDLGIYSKYKWRYFIRKRKK
jgi:hypothetical protein